MCGITGQIDFRGRPIDPNDVLKMNARQAHRGPDGEGAVFLFPQRAPKVFSKLDANHIQSQAAGATGALAHRRLAIIDLSAGGAQPMSAANGNLWVTYNGEIYNYIELRDELHALGHRFRSDSDTEVILRAYQEWGEGCVEHFNGMFAFGIWDEKKQKLICARDRLGIKPFYFRNSDGVFAFASEPKALLAALNGRPSANAQAMAEYLSLSYVLSTETMFKGIYQLRPGHLLIADARGVQQRAYWDPTFDPNPGAAQKDWAPKLADLLNESMRLQIRSDVPVGAHLSGGIDSSLICSLAAKNIPKLLTFSARFSGGDAFDEGPFARLVAQRLDTDHHELIPNSKRLNKLLPTLIYHLDEPVEGPATVGKYHVAEGVSQSVKVVLTGHGGDELFGGYDWYIKSLFTAAMFGGRSEIGGHPYPSFLLRSLLREEYPRRLAKSLWTNFGDRNLSRIFFRNWDRFRRGQLKKVLHADIANQITDPQRVFVDTFHSLSEARRGDGMFKFDMQHYLSALLTSEDRLSMAFSVEARVPLLDHRIAELAGGLGFELKTQPGHSKPVLRSAAAGVIAPEILARKDKRGFPTPVATWLRDPDLNLFDEFVFSGNSFAERYFDLDHVRRLLGARIHLGTDWSEQLWRVLNLSVWGQVFDVE